MSDEAVEKREAMNRTRDIICPHASTVDPAEVRRTCERFDEARTAFSEEIGRDRRALCRGFCPVSGSCEPGFTEVAGLTAESWSDGRDAQGMRLDIWHGSAPPPEGESRLPSAADLMAEPSSYGEKNHRLVPGIPRETEIMDLWVIHGQHSSFEASGCCLAG